MSTVISVLRFASDWRVWPEIRRRAVNKLFRRVDSDSAARAEAICAASAVSPTACLADLGFPPMLLAFADEQPARLAQAKAKHARIGTKMGGAADLDLLYTLCVACDAKAVLETGVAFGWSSVAILSAITRLPDAHLTSIDLPYPRQNTRSLVGMAVPKDLRRNWTLLRGADRENIPFAIWHRGPFDLVHYDSDKSYWGRRWAYPLLWGAIRPGGLLMSDDIADNMGFLDFCKDIGQDAAIVKSGNKFVGCLRKPASPI